MPPLSVRAPRSQADSHEAAAIGRYLSLPGNPSAALRASSIRVLPKFGPQCGAKTRGEAGRLTVMECEQRQAIERYKQDMENSVLRLGSLSEEGRIFSKLNAQCADRLEAHKKDCPICKAS